MPRVAASCSGTATGTAALHKIEAIIRKGNTVEILRQHLKTSAKKLKLGRTWTQRPSILPK